MSNRHDSRARTFCETALAELGPDGCVALAQIADDLRSGVIPPEAYDQRWDSGEPPCCIRSHLSILLGRMFSTTVPRSHAMFDLFSASHPSDPQLAARAIDRYFAGEYAPWAA